MTVEPETLAAQVVRRTLDRPPTLGRSRLICIDGPAGSGKTTLADAVVAAADAHATTALVHMDDQLDGWGGLPDALPRVARDVLGPLREGRPGHYRRYDWLAERFAETHVVEPVDLVVLEGVGSGSSLWAAGVTTLVWVEAPADLRLARGLARDGEEVREQFVAWMVQEEVLHARERTRARADLLVDTSLAQPPAGRSST